MKKIFVLILLLCATATAALAESVYPYMAFNLKTGNPVVVKVEGLRITVTDGNLVVKNDEGTTTIALKDMNYMAFATNLMSVDVTEADGQLPTDVYTTTGCYAGHFESFAQARQALAPGLYIFSNSKKTIKVQITR